jgi:hypothetical protein
VLVNTLRGSIVDEDALVRAVRVGDQSRLAACLQPVTLPRILMVLEWCSSRSRMAGCDDRVAEGGAPLSIALVRGQDDAAAIVTCTHQLEENGGAEIVQWREIV